MYLRLITLILTLLPLCAPSQSLRLVTYNIRYDNPQDGENAWDKRRDRLCAQMRFHAPDIIGVQEALKHQLDYMLEKLPGYAYVGAGRDDGDTSGEYSAIFFRRDRFVILDGSTFWLSETPDQPSKGWDAALNRVCTYAHLRDSLTGRPFWVFNTHFDHIGQVARLASATLILRRMRALNQKKEPEILLGDLNAEPDDAPIRVIKEQLSDTRERSEEPAFGPEGTFNGFNFHQPVRKRIDYIFVGPKIRVQRHAVLSDSYDCRYLSDHLPVLVDIRY